MFVRLLILLVALSNLSTAQAQADSKEEKVSILDKRAQVERTRWLFDCWERVPSTRLQSPDLGGKPTYEYVRMFVTPEQFKVLQGAYEKRKQAYDELYAKMNTFDVIRRRAQAVRKGGLTEDQAAKMFRAPRGFVDPSEEEIEDAFGSYIQAQDEAEDEWAAVVEEVLSPEQFAKVSPYFTKAGLFYLRNPLFARYLALDKAQVREIQKLTDLYYSQLEQAKTKVKSDKIFDDPSMRVAYRKPFTVLKPEQFKMLDTIVLNRGESWADYRARLKKDDPVSKMLLPLIDGILEDKEKK